MFCSNVKVQGYNTFSTVKLGSLLKIKVIRNENQDVTLHGLVLHWSDVFKTRWRDIPVLLHLLLLLTVWRTAV